MLKNQQLKKKLKKIFLKESKMESTLHKEQVGKKIIARGLLLPKDKISRNGILYDWESVKTHHNKLKGLPMLYNHLNEGDKKPVGRFTDTTILESRPAEEGKWRKTWDETAKELDVPEGVPGWYYESDINPNSEYSDSILRHDISKVSIQVMAGEQKKEKKEDGNYYTRAYVSDILESSAVPTPGFIQTSMVIMSESFNVKTIKESLPDGFDKTANHLYDKNYNDLGEVQKKKVRRWLTQNPDMKYQEGDEKMEDDLKETHMNIGDEIDVKGQKMRVANVLDDGYELKYAESQSTVTNPGATTTKLPDKKEESEEESDEIEKRLNNLENKNQKEVYNNMEEKKFEEKIITILESLVERVEKIEDNKKEELSEEDMPEEPIEESDDKEDMDKLVDVVENIVRRLERLEGCSKKESEDEEVIENVEEEKEESKESVDEEKKEESVDEDKKEESVDEDKKEESTDEEPKEEPKDEEPKEESEDKETTIKEELEDEEKGEPKPPITEKLNLKHSMRVESTFKPKNDLKEMIGKFMK